MSENNSTNLVSPIRRTAETAIRLAILFLLLYWCYTIVKPFIDILLWSVIFAVSLYPMYKWLCSRLGGKKTLSATILIILMLLVLLLPGLLFARSLYEGVAYLKTQYETAGNLVIPAASENVAELACCGTFFI